MFGSGLGEAAGTEGSIADITFTVASTASGSTPLDLVVDNNGFAPTEVNGGQVSLSPPAGSAANDGTVNIVVNPEQPPFDGLPTPAAIAAAEGGTGVLFNPASVAGLQAPTPNTVVFSSANGDAITVSDSSYSSTGAAETTTVSVIGTPTGTSTGPVGTLNATASGAATVSGNGTATLTITGSPADITNTLNGLIYQPGAGFFGTTTLKVSTDDNSNSGFGGPLTDTRTTSLTVVGLFISEIDLDKVNTTNPSQYVEVFSTVPNYTIPSSVYLLGIDGTTVTGVTTGAVTDIFNLGGGFTTGTNGFLALLEARNNYANLGDTVSANSVFNNTGTGAGFGTGSTSKFNGISGVHTGGSRPTGQLATDILTVESESFLLVQGGTTPTTTLNIDPNGNGTPGGTAYNSWNVLDSVGILNAASGSHSYAAVTFKPSSSTGTTPGGSSVISTGTWAATYVGRIAENTGTSNGSWLGSVITGTATAGLTLSSTQSTAFGAQPLNNVGGPNDWAPQEAVVVNDGSSTQHSQVAELTVTFNEPVDIVDLASDFQVVDAGGNVLSITVTDPDTGATTAGATGPVPDDGATVLVISFNEGSVDTFNFGTAAFTDANYGYQPTVGLVDGNYFLHTTVADISSAANSSVLLDGDHNGASASTSPNPNSPPTSPYNGQGLYEVDEFWRLFGDTLGRRKVDNTDLYTFNQAYGSSLGAGSYLWYLDYNEDGTINATDKTAFNARRFTGLPA
jgi:hypothetical protein